MRNLRPHILALVLFSACASVPITCRKQLGLVPESQLLGVSFTEYETFLSGNKTPPATDPRTITVKRNGPKLAQASTRYLEENRAADLVEGFGWEFDVVEDDQVNA